MNGIRSKLGLLVLVSGVAIFGLATGPAFASTGTAAVAGSGTISPGLTTVGHSQSITFGGTAVVAGTTGSGTYTCNFTGTSDILETIQTGDGNASGTCNGTVPTVQSFTCTVHYTRTGGVVTLTGNCTGSVNGPLAAAGCVLEPTSANPAKSYELQCDLNI